MPRIIIPLLLNFIALFSVAQKTSSGNIPVKQINTSTLISCNNWLATPSQPSAVDIGDLDIPGNQITVEAVINRTAPYTGSYLYAGDIVAKHQGPPDVNYLLRPDDAEITTTNGYFATQPICDIQLNKTYHIAMVYNG